MEPAVVRLAGLTLPWLLAVLLGRWLRPGARLWGAIILSSLWVVAFLPALNWVAVQAGWWRFTADGGILLGLPLDLYLGWVVLWGVLPQFMQRLPLWAVMSAFALLDVLVMPQCGSVLALSDNWLMGEVVLLAGLLLPSLALGRWVAQESKLACRAALQLLTFAALFFVWLPAVVLQFAKQSSLQNPATDSTEGLGLRWLVLPVMLVVLIPGWSAVQEFVQRGKGTPFPLDPTKRLVVSGPYRYVTNPMQLSMVLALGLMAVLLESPVFALSMPIGVLFSAGFAALSENEQLVERFGERWIQYRQRLSAWIPRWRPMSQQDLNSLDQPTAFLHIASDRGVDSHILRWFERHDLQALELRAHDLRPLQSIEWLTYDPRDGSDAQHGVQALARGLEHIHLAWALLGMALRLPFVREVAQWSANCLGLLPVRIGQREPRRAAP